MYPLISFTQYDGSEKKINEENLIILQCFLQCFPEYGLQTSDIEIK